MKLWELFKHISQIYQELSDLSYGIQKIFFILGILGTYL
jgi:hypothetical protein